MKRPDRRQAAERWARVAAGDLDDELRAWLADVASKLLKANAEKDSNDFRIAVTKAVGFSGSKGPAIDHLIRDIADAMGPDAFTNPETKAGLRAVVRVLREDRVNNPTDGAIDAQIRRALAG